MASLIRLFAWGQNPLGEIQAWTPALRLSVSMVLKAQHPAALFWGPQQICLYNDAFAALLAESGPSLLGLPAARAFPRS